MKRVFVGHRGVGKTSLLARHAKYFPSIPTYDLDTEIEKKIQSSINDFFKMFPEEKFRTAERDVFNTLTRNRQDYVIAVGAGFPVSYIPLDVEVIYVSRMSDVDGRIFLNRPRLNQKLTPLAEYKERYDEREPEFRKRAQFIYHMPEGIETPIETEENLLIFDFKINDAYYTLCPNEVNYIHQRVQNFLKIELRTDLLTAEQMNYCIEKYPQHNWLISIRNDVQFDLPQQAEFDCDVRFYKGQKIQILSTHEDQLDKALKQISPYENKFHIKLCPLIESFEELRKGYEWQQKNPSNRSFLPRSLTGNWNWFRLLSRYTQHLHFVRNFTEQADQPTVYQWLTLPKTKPVKWAAVVGKPIHFSRSPVRHENFFKKLATYMCTISMRPVEFEQNIDWLYQLGLAYIAVTSPLKEMAYKLATSSSDQAEELKSVNTLVIDDEKISGHNTDLGGFSLLVGRLKLSQSRTVAVWGGGGTLQMMKRVLPKATFFSSQTGQDRDKKINQIADFDVVIWAAPRSPQTVLPPLDWPVQLVVDLNYAENSMGIEYAQKLISLEKSVQYISGINMFNEQARQQQQFWSAL